MTDVMVAKGLAKSFGDLVAVDGVGFTIGEGETYGLLGPNGAGKTTTISMIAGLLQADEGEVRVGGELISPKSVAPKRRMGLVPQELAIYPDLTARENLEFFGRLYGMGGAELAQRAERVLAVVGLDERQKDLTKEFSGGMKRHTRPRQLGEPDRHVDVGVRIVRLPAPAVPVAVVDQAAEVEPPVEVVRCGDSLSTHQRPLELGGTDDSRT